MATLTSKPLNNAQRTLEVAPLSNQVTPPDASSMMEAQGELDNLFQSGNVNKAMQMAFAVLSANKGTDDARSVSSLDLTIS